MQWPGVAGAGYGMKAYGGGGISSNHRMAWRLMSFAGLAGVMQCPAAI
jgi:hypothetical protein